jgi:hypothetical protein
MVAGTIVLRERQGSGRSVAMSFPVPYGYEAYVQSLDVSSVREDQYQLIRTFLLRVWELAPEARASLALRLANPLAVQMRHTPPAMVGPELFLVCVAAAYQLRHGGPLAPSQPVPGPGVGPPDLSAYPSAGYPLGGYPHGGYALGGYPQGGYPPGGYPAGRYPQGGYAPGANPGWPGSAPPPR